MRRDNGVGSSLALARLWKFYKVKFKKAEKVFLDVRVALPLYGSL